jgi:hypothetical protein
VLTCTGLALGQLSLTCFASSDFPNTPWLLHYQVVHQSLIALHKAFSALCSNLHAKYLVRNSETPVYHAMNCLKTTDIDKKSKAYHRIELANFSLELPRREDITFFVPQLMQ